MVPAYRAGRTIVTNIKGVRPEYWAAVLEPLKGKSLGEITVVDEDFFNEEANYPLMSKKGEVQAAGAIPAGALVVIDEAYLVYPTGPVHADDAAREEKGSGGITRRMVEFVRTHRHFVSEEGIASDIVCISQDVESLHPRIRAVSEFVTKIRNMRYVGMSRRYRVDVFNSWRCTKSQMIGSSHRRYDLAIFKLYKSFEADGAAKVVMTDKSHKAVKWYHWLFGLALIGCFAFALSGLSGAKSALTASTPISVRPTIAGKPDCDGSGVLVDLTGRRAFLNGQWRVIDETTVGPDGRTRWDVGPCWLRFGA